MSTLPEQVKQRIETQVKSHPIVIFMKGTPDFPQCGFSAATVECFQRLGVAFETVDVLADWDIREGIKQYSNWPTIPQVYVNGKFVGGCDIVRDMYQSGELEKVAKPASS